MENSKREIKVNEKGQTKLVFPEDKTSVEHPKEGDKDEVDVVKIVDDLNKKHPYARLNPSRVKYDKGFYIISEKKMNLEELEEYIIDLHNTYKPEDDEPWFNK